MGSLLDLVLNGAGVANQMNAAGTRGDLQARDRNRAEAQQALQLQQAQEDRSLSSLLKQSQIGENDAHAHQMQAPKGPVAPVLGSPEYIAAQEGLEKMRAKYRREPQAPSGQVMQGPNGPVIVDTRSGTSRAITGPDGKPIPGKAAAGRAMPASAVDKMIALDNMSSAAQEVQTALNAAVKNKTNATGRTFGVLPTPNWAKNAVGMGGKEGEDVRTILGNLYGMVAKERGGTALSATEIRLLESYLPNQNEDEATALRKANHFLRALETMKQNRVKEYGKYGYGSGAGVVDDQSPMSDQLDSNSPSSVPPARDPLLDKYGLTPKGRKP